METKQIPTQGDKEMTKIDMTDKWLTVGQVAEILQVAQETVKRWTRSHKLASYKLGRKTLRISIEDLETFMLERREQQNGTEAQTS